jgi:DMSO/TMAO reductase YedYZ molybdopterin-dependent catalytic subunit
MPNAGRTINGIPPMAQAQAADPHLRLTGAVPAERSLQPADLAALPRIEYIGGMNCNESGRQPDARWTGIPLSAFVQLGAAAPATRYVNVSAGPYAVAIEIEQADAVFLADRLENEPIAVEQGGPWRLIIPEGRFFDSVKWVDTIEFSLDTPNHSAERIAQARARAREKHAESA